jgi:hypothetical protein
VARMRMFRNRIEERRLRVMRVSLVDAPNL